MAPTPSANNESKAYGRDNQGDYRAGVDSLPEAEPDSERADMLGFLRLLSAHPERSR
jgi:hypothetical protein